MYYHSSKRYKIFFFQFHSLKIQYPMYIGTLDIEETRLTQNQRIKEKTK